MEFWLDRIGKIEIKETPEETRIEWAIEDVSVLEEKQLFRSPNFTFNGSSWKMLGIYSPMNFLFCIYNQERHNFLTEHEICVKYPDGYLEPLLNSVVKSTRNVSISWLQIKTASISEHKSTLSTDVLSIICHLKNIDNSTQASVMDKFKYNELIKLDTLSENFKNILFNKESCDTVLNVKDKEYRVHRAVLIARSSVFASMFLHDSKEKQTGIVNISDCDPDSFEEFLEFLYCGKLKTLTSHSALNLYETSEKYDVQELKTFATECLKKNLTADNLCDVVVIADAYDDTELLASVQCFFNKNLSEIFVTPAWYQLLRDNRRLANKLLIEMANVKEAPKQE